MPVQRTIQRRKLKRRPILGLGIRDGWKQYLAGMATEMVYGLLVLATCFAIALIVMAVWA